MICYRWLACITGALAAIAFPTAACARTSWNDSSEEIVPLESDIIFAFSETSDELLLKMWTEKLYGTGSNGIAATLYQYVDSRLVVEVRGIDLCEGCDTAVGPAWRDLPLSVPSGLYTLTFEWTRPLVDSYALQIAPSGIILTPTVSIFTRPRYLEWKRLPPDTIQIVVTPDETEYRNREDFEKQAQRFLQALDQLEMEEFVPEEGHYTDPAFVPPWPSWQKPASDSFGLGSVEIPTETRNSVYLLRWPIIKYYDYGDWETITSLVDTYHDNGIYISARIGRGASYVPPVKVNPTPAPIPISPFPTPPPPVQDSPIATPTP